MRHLITKRSIFSGHIFLLSALGILILSTTRCKPNKTIDNTCEITLTVTSDLPSGSVPMDPVIDFEKIINEVRLPGVLNPNSITIINKATGKSVPFALSEDFAYNDRGRLEWVISDPAHKIFKIRFRTTQKRPSVEPSTYTPLVGVGDLLRYNANEPRPISLPYPARLIDLTGDGKRDLVGCWNYAHRPGWPWDGIFLYPREGNSDNFEFGDLVRIRYVSHADSTDFNFFSNVYMFADFADLNRDNLIDIVYCPNGSDQLFFYLNSGKRDKGGMPIFVASDTVPRQTDEWHSCRAVDLNQDGAIDFVIGDLFLKNTNPDSWPVKLAKGVFLNANTDSVFNHDVTGGSACFYDVNGDKKPDAVYLKDIATNGDGNFAIAWKQNLGGDIPEFGHSKQLYDINCPYPRDVAAVNDGSHRGLLISHNHYEKLSFFEQTNTSGSAPQFKISKSLKSVAAVLALPTQAWPYLCDWDNDGDLDLLAGGGFGWPRILINEGSNDKMAFAESQFILSEGTPIRLTRNKILGGDHFHDYGYPYPAFIDWDNDGLPDLLLPNETNRIFWYKNIGTLEKPQFGPQLQIICDGYPDSPKLRSLSARRAKDVNRDNYPYPYEKERPFLWRTGAAFADWNNDGLMDFITHDGYTHKATLFTQYKDKEGVLRLKKDYTVKLTDGRLIDDKIVNRTDHWTESFKAVDWDADGLTDLIYACAGSLDNSSIYLLQNVGTKGEPVFAAPRTFSCYGEPIKVTYHGPHPWVGDMDGDGKPDVLTCVELSIYPFFSHNAIEMKRRPKYTVSIPE